MVTKTMEFGWRDEDGVVVVKMARNKGQNEVLSSRIRKAGFKQDDVVEMEES